MSTDPLVPTVSEGAVDLPKIPGLRGQTRRASLQGDDPAGDEVVRRSPILEKPLEKGPN